jgi:hypothetical protein
VDPEKCKGYDIICVNNFSLTQAFERLKPDTIILWDPCYNDLGLMGQALRALAGSDFCNNIVWPHGVPLDRALALMPPSKKHIFLPTAHNYFLPWFNPKRWMLGGGGVVHVGLNFAIQMGYKEIVLVGFEHDHIVRDLIIPKDNRIYLKESHFYQENEKEIEGYGDLTYRHNGQLYRSYDPDKPDTDLRVVFMRNWLFHQVFYTLGRIARKRGIRIFNASPLSWIMTFPKIDPADLDKPL